MNNKLNILVVGDLHAPFIKKGYLAHCKKVYSDYNCNKVIFIGDIIDSHASGFHESDPDGQSAGDELSLSIKVLEPWYKVFPVADVCIGNHDRIIMRKAYNNGVSKRWIRDFNEVLCVPGWNFQVSFEYDNVLYIHGEGGGGINGALSKVLNRRKSIVQGHWHTEAHIRWNVSELDRLFAMQVGSGMDDKAYAAAYAQFFTRKSIVSCAVVLDKGRLPIIIPMNLK
jgi:hypothetical protein